jgi:hypothetical protein
MHKFPEIPKMNFNGQPNMFFGKIFSYTCDLHLKLNILNPLNTICFFKWFFFLNSFSLQPSPSNFKYFEIFV